jgi:hypothetical protein
MIAALARQLPNGTQGGSKRHRAHPTRRPAAGADNFAETFRTNASALLKAMADQQPPPSIEEIIEAIRDPEAAKSLGQTPLAGRKVAADAERREKIIKYLQQQESLSGIFGPELDPELAMWMYMIMP